MEIKYECLSKDKKTRCVYLILYEHTTDKGKHVDMWACTIAYKKESDKHEGFICYCNQAINKPVYAPPLCPLNIKYDKIKDMTDDVILGIKKI